MGAGDRWRLPGAHEALELPGSTRDVLRLCVIDPTWPWPKPPAWALCERLPSRYLHGAVPNGTKSKESKP